MRRLLSPWQESIVQGKLEFFSAGVHFQFSLSSPTTRGRRNGPIQARGVGKEKIESRFRRIEERTQPASYYRQFLRACGAGKVMIVTDIAAFIALQSTPPRDGHLEVLIVRLA